ncbi:hypothetical protein N431DRAFT_155923 [Stipitochalara longipes BDJ]|nr:hypothetical protein N431DRAFT_155923 [Stipitochalara longipes BDJ]
MADWLRPVFARTKTPVLGFTDRQGSFSADDKSEDGDLSKLRPTSRVSSYMNVRSNTPPIPQTPGSFANIRSPESVYHKPSVDHMAETLKVVMMNQSSVDSVPIAYNACILHVLEAYQDLRMELAKKESFLKELKLSHTKDIHDFEALATQWEMKEVDYKKELKKLEVLLSQTDGGMEKVTLARTHSAVHGSRATEIVQRGIGTMRERNCERNRAVKQPFHSKLNARSQSNTRSSFQAEGISGKRQPCANIFRSRGSSASQALLQIYQPPTPERLSSLARSKFDGVEQQQEDRENVLAFDSSASGLESSANSSHNEMPYLGSRVGLGIDIDEKPLPKIPSVQELDKSERTREVCEFGSSNYTLFDSGGGNPKMSSFSFKSGDDTDILAQSMANNFETKSAAAIRAYQSRSTYSEEQPERTYPSGQDVEGSRLPKSTPFGHKAKIYSKPGQDLQDCEALKRDGSNSSIIMAVRVDSRRSSVDSSKHNSQNSRQRLNRNSGSSEAVTAAVRALANSASMSARNSPRKGSSTGTSSKGEKSPRIDERDETSDKAN